MQLAKAFLLQMGMPSLKQWWTCKPSGLSSLNMLQQLDIFNPSHVLQGNHQISTHISNCGRPVHISSLAQGFPRLLLSYCQFHSGEQLPIACSNWCSHTFQHDPVFHNKCNNHQMHVHLQLAIHLCRHGHYRNGAAVEEIAELAG